MNRAKLPSNVGPLNPRLEKWLRESVEPAARPRTSVEFLFPLADTEYRVRHRLPHVPDGYRPVSLDKAGIVYSSKPADEFYLYLKSSVASLTVVLEVS